MAYPGLILANAALGEGVETHLFFTFWGFDMITKATMGDLKFTMLGNTATHMPQGLGGLPGMTAMATSKMKKAIADLDVPEVPEFLEQIVASGGHLWACRMSADMNHLTDGGPLRGGRGHHQRQRLHREDQRRAAAVHLSIWRRPDVQPTGAAERAVGLLAQPAGLQVSDSGAHRQVLECELAEGVVRARSVDCRGAAVHEEGDADRLGGLLTGGAGLGGRLGVRRDTAVAALDDGDGQRDQLLGGNVERAVREGRPVQLTEALVCLGMARRGLSVERGTARRARLCRADWWRCARRRGRWSWFSPGWWGWSVGRGSVGPRPG